MIEIEKKIEQNYLKKVHFLFQLTNTHIYTICNVLPTKKKYKLQCYHLLT